MQFNTTILDGKILEILLKSKLQKWKIGLCLLKKMYIGN